MKLFTDKEIGFLLEYTKELIKIMEEENDNMISDNLDTYTLSEIKSIAKKIEKIND